MLITLVALVLPLGLDTFAVAAALGMAGLPREQRLRVTLLFTAFEAGMPLVGLAGGGAVGRTLGGAADLLAIIILLGLGLFLLRPDSSEADQRRVALLARTRGLAALALGVSISLDELAIGFTLGLLRLPVALVVLLIAVQTIVVVQLGLRVGIRVGERVAEGSERLAGLALLGLGLVLLVTKLRESGVLGAIAGAAG